MVGQFKLFNSSMRNFANFTIALALFGLSTSASVAAPRHIVSTFLCTDEYVFRLVPRAHIAALSFEAGDRNPIVSTIADQVGGMAQIHPSTETVLNLHPDLVVMYQNTMPRLHANLLALGVAVFDVPWANSIADIRATTRMLGDKLEARGRADAMIATMDAQLAAIRARAPRVSVRALIYEPNGYATTGGVTQELMGIAGLVNAAPGMNPTRAGTVPVEAVIAAAPELLIFSGQSGASNSRAVLVQHHPALAALAGRTFSAWTSLTPLGCPGPWSADAAQTFLEFGVQARALAKPDSHN